MTDTASIIKQWHTLHERLSKSFPNPAALHDAANLVAGLTLALSALEGERLEQERDIEDLGRQLKAALEERDAARRWARTWKRYAKAVEHDVEIFSRAMAARRGQDAQR